MRVWDVMTSEVGTVRPETPLKDVGKLLSERGFSGVPVVDRDRTVVGVVSETDIVSKMRGSVERDGVIRRLLFRGRKARARTAGDAMTSPAVTVSPEEPVSAAARLMAEHGISRLPVVDEERLVGIVARADVVRSFVRSDQTIAEELEETLDRFWLPPGTVTATVVNGEVMLDGEVDSKENAEMLEWAVGQIPGVVAVRSSLRSRSRARDFRA